MRNFLGTLVIVAIIVAALGFYLGWFEFSKSDGTNGTNVDVKVNDGKIKSDLGDAVDHLREGVEDVEDKVDQATKGK